MTKNSLKNVESDNNKILNETLLDFFLQRNCIYFLNKPRIEWYSCLRNVILSLLHSSSYTAIWCVLLRRASRCYRPVIGLTEDEAT